MGASYTAGDYAQAAARMEIARSEQDQRDHPERYTTCAECGAIVARHDLATGEHELACYPE